MSDKWDKEYLTPLNEAIFLDVLKDKITCAEIATKHDIRKDKVRNLAYRFARGLYGWAHFEDRLDLLCGDKLSPWGTLSEYRVHYRQWLALYREWQKEHKGGEE